MLEQLLADTNLESIGQGNPIGRVDRAEEHTAVGYRSHPAVVDSSMHLGVYLGSPDGRTRVPGKGGIECNHKYFMSGRTKLPHRTHLLQHCMRRGQ